MAIYNCIDKCNGCKHSTAYSYFDTSPEGAVCEIYLRPYSKWGKLGGCEGATHVKRAVEETKQRVGQQKQKKVK